MKSFSNKFSCLIACFFLLAGTANAGNKPKREIYQLTVYQYSSTAQEAVLNNYFKNALAAGIAQNGLQKYWCI